MYIWYLWLYFQVLCCLPVSIHLSAAFWFYDGHTEWQILIALSLSKTSINLGVLRQRWYHSGSYQLCLTAFSIISVVPEGLIKRNNIVIPFVAGICFLYSLLAALCEASLVPLFFQSPSKMTFQHFKLIWFSHIWFFFFFWVNSSVLVAEKCTDIEVTSF